MLYQVYVKTPYVAVISCTLIYLKLSVLAVTACIVHVLGEFTAS